MSLFRKLLILFGLLTLVILTSTLAIVYSASRTTITALSKEKAISIIQTIDSALESNIPDRQFEPILIHLRQKDPNIEAFDIYKLNGYLYDIASLDKHNIGKQFDLSSVLVLTKDQPVSTLHGTNMEIIVPIRGYKGETYYARVKFSIADDLKKGRALLIKILLVGLCAFVLTVVCAWFFTREFLSKPVLAVVSAVNEVGTGNLQIDLTSSERRRDEIGTLARSFQRMTTNLQQLMGGMAQTADELNHDFERLVKNGDHSARGALRISDVVTHVSVSARTLSEQLGLAKEGLNKVIVDMESPEASTSPDVPLADIGPVLAERVRVCLEAVQRATEAASDMDRQLKGVTPTVDGQLGAISNVNRTASRLSQMASDLRKLIATFET